MLLFVARPAAAVSDPSRSQPAASLSDVGFDVRPPRDDGERWDAEGRSMSRTARAHRHPVRARVPGGGAALYAGEGGKREGGIAFANSDPRMIFTFWTGMRTYFEIDESRMRLRLYLHKGLDLEGANRFWSDLTAIPECQFGKPHRAEPDPSIRRSKHPMGCPSIRYSCSTTHRTVMGLVHALLSCESLPSGVAQLAERRPVKPIVVGSSPTPGAS